MTANQSGEPQLVVPAATVVIFRQGARPLPEILMVQRSAGLSFAGAASVFPGGKVHPADAALAGIIGGDHALADAAGRIAAIRETIEETGLVIGIGGRASAFEAEQARAMLREREDLAPILAQFGWSLDLARIVPFAHWLPNYRPGRIFDTRFYLADIGTGAVDLTPDHGETTRLFWTTAQDALEMDRKGQIMAIYPTRRNLERLAQFASFADSCADAAAIGLPVVTPWIEHQGDARMLRIAENLGYPVTIAPYPEGLG